MGPEAFVAELQILARADVENVVQAKRIVDADAQIALKLAGRARAGIVDRGDNSPWLHALYADHDIALARYICRLDLHVDVLARDALHLLKALLEVAQVQQFIAACRKRRFPGATNRRTIGRIGESQLPDDAGYKRELQFAMRQVLLGQQYARRDVAAAQDQLRQPLDDQVESLFADTLVGVVGQPFAGERKAVQRQRRGTLRADGIGQQRRHIKREAIDAKTRFFAGQHRIRTGGRRRRTHGRRVDRALAFLRLALLLDDLFLLRGAARGVGDVGGCWSRLRRCVGEHQEVSSQHCAGYVEGLFVIGFHEAM
ncbi:hypothetical protein R75465_07888 [Paraburkholderia aspalathi]|nr:hypothetical protein R75465_07888 [Paraburkholderia aspalathi]